MSWVFNPFTGNFDWTAAAVSIGTGTAGQVVKWGPAGTTLVDAALIPPATNILTLTATAASTLGLAITAGKTLTLTATDNFNLTIPATGVAALLGTANVFTALQTVQISNSAKSLSLQYSKAYATAASFTSDKNDTGWSGYTMRQVIASAQISNTGLVKVRISVKAASTSVLNVGAMYIGTAAATGDAYDFDGTPTQVTFAGGSAGFSALAGSTTVSDEITFTILPGKNLVISVYCSGVSGFAGKATSAGWTSYYRGAINDAATVNATGYANWSATTPAIGFVLIEAGTPTASEYFYGLDGAIAGNKGTIGTVTTADTFATLVLGSNSIYSKPLVLQMAAGHVANPFELQSSDGTILSYMSKLGNLILGKNNTPNARFAMYDNNAPVGTGYLSEWHQDDNSPYIAGYFNDTVSVTVPSAAYYIDGSGNFNFGSVGATNIQFFTNDYANTKMVILASGLVGIGYFATPPLARLHVLETTTTANAPKETFRIEARVSTAATGGAAGFGVGQTFYGETATDGTNQLMAQIAAVYTEATNATFKAKLQLSAKDAGGLRLGLEIEASGTAPKLGFFGGTTAVQQVLAAYTSDGEGAAYTGIDNLQVGTVYATVADLNQLRVAYETLRASYDDLRTKLQTSTIVG